MSEKFIVLFILFMLATPFAFGATALSTSYSVGSFHIGSLGSEGNSSGYDMRDTLTYEQGGTDGANSTDYEGNDGWFEAPEEVLEAAAEARKERGEEITAFVSFMNYELDEDILFYAGIIFISLIGIGIVGTSSYLVYMRFKKRKEEKGGVSDDDEADEEDSH